MANKRATVSPLTITGHPVCCPEDCDVPWGPLSTGKVDADNQPTRAPSGGAQPEPQGCCPQGDPWLGAGVSRPSCSAPSHAWWFTAGPGQGPVAGQGDSQDMTCVEQGRCWSQGL